MSGTRRRVIVMVNDLDELAHPAMSALRDFDHDIALAPAEWRIWRRRKQGSDNVPSPVYFPPPGILNLSTLRGAEAFIPIMSEERLMPVDAAKVLSPEELDEFLREDTTILVAHTYDELTDAADLIRRGGGVDDHVQSPVVIVWFDQRDLQPEGDG